MPKQREFLSTPRRAACFCGGVGSGKTVALCTAAILNSAADPNGFSLIGRLNMPALENSTMKSFLELVPETYGKWEPTAKRFRFMNGHEIIFKHLDMADPKISGHIKSMNLSAAYVDEATEIAEDIYLLLLSRLRRKTAPRQVLRMATNPAGHDWVWRRFFNPERDERLHDNLGITVSTFDNPFLPAEYIENLRNQYPDDWAQRYLYGSFSDFSDLIYKEFGDHTHTWQVNGDYAIFGGGSEPPLHWPVIVGIDIGSDSGHDPWAISVIAIAPDARLFQFAEVYGNNMLIAEVARQLKPHLEGRKIYGIAYDYANRQAGAVELPEHGIYGQPADKDVTAGLFKTAQYFHIDQRLVHPFHPERVHGSPYFMVRSDCQHTIQEIAAYKWARDRSGNPTGDPSHEHSHSPDAIRYAIHTFRPLPAELKVKKVWENPQLDQLSRDFWKAEDERDQRMKGYTPDKRGPLTMQQWEYAAKQHHSRFSRPKYMNYKRW